MNTWERSIVWQRNGRLKAGPLGRGGGPSGPLNPEVQKRRQEAMAGKPRKKSGTDRERRGESQEWVNEDPNTLVGARNCRSFQTGMTMRKNTPHPSPLPKRQPDVTDQGSKKRRNENPGVKSGISPPSRSPTPEGKIAYLPRAKAKTQENPGTVEGPDYGRDGPQLLLPLRPEQCHATSKEKNETNIGKEGIRSGAGVRIWAGIRGLLVHDRKSSDPS